MSPWTEPPALGGEPHCDPDSVCITCGDVAIALRVLAVDDERGLALCADGDDRRETVETALVGTVDVGEELLVHAGTAIAKPEAAGVTTRRER